MATPPYTPAHLVNSEKPVTERWYIVFWVWDALKQKKVRKRCYKVNLKKTKMERLAYAKTRIAGINKLLAEGYHSNPKLLREKKAALYADRTKDYSIYDAFKYILPVVKNSKRPATFNSYNSCTNLFLEFCELAGWTGWKLRTLEKVDIISFLDYVQAPKEGKAGVSNASRNKYLSYLAAMFTMLQERGALDKNVCHGIKFLKEETGGNIAYTPEQIEVLKAAINEQNPRLWLFVSFMLYGFIRPAEIGRLQVRMINLKTKEIKLPGTITKNGKPRTVTISPHFAEYISSMSLELYRPDHYVFGINLVTGAIPIQKNYANLSHSKIARKLGFGKEYTLYSWKHTGVVLHYKAGIDIKTLQKQIGHQSLHETDIYLKSLDLYENSEIIDKSPAI
ncbi:tyrosine-type recombinase/integrase [Mucilaginibacter terrenus]|nr:site-specific integrase [Mucilaginibacter terrenus]